MTVTLSVHTVAVRIVSMCVVLVALVAAQRVAPVNVPVNVRVAAVAVMVHATSNVLQLARVVPRE